MEWLSEPSRLQLTHFNQQGLSVNCNLHDRARSGQSYRRYSKIEKCEPELGSESMQV